MPTDRERSELIRTALSNPEDLGTVRHLGTFLAGLVDGPVDELAADIYRSDWLREVKAKAWDEGLGHRRKHNWRQFTSENPYREEG